MEESIPLYLTIISARDLSHVNFFTKMDVYAVASVSSNHCRKHKTHVDMGGGRNPNWNYPTTINVPTTNNHGIILSFKLFSSHILRPDRLIGEVLVPIKDLLNTFHHRRQPSVVQFVSYQVRKPSGKPQGILNFSYKFIGEVVRANQPITACYDTTATSAPVIRAPPMGKPHPSMLIAPPLGGTTTPSTLVPRACGFVAPPMGKPHPSAPPALGLIPSTEALRVPPPPMGPYPSAPMYPGPVIGYEMS